MKICGYTFGYLSTFLYCNIICYEPLGINRLMHIKNCLMIGES